MKMLFTIALGIVFMIPTLTTTSADGYNDRYVVQNPGWWVDVHTSPNLQGRLKCRIPHGEHLKFIRQTSDRKYVYVQWYKKWGYGSGGHQWRDPHNRRLCNLGNREGWVAKYRIKKIGHPNPNRPWNLWTRGN